VLGASEPEKQPSDRCHRRGECGQERITLRRMGVTAVLLLLSLTAALADVRILASPGGPVGPYLKLFSVLRQSGQRVVIDGPCFSACTLVLSAMPRDRICVTRRAMLGFHAPRWIDVHGREYPASAETRLVAATYPAVVRDWIKRHGGLTPKVIYLRGRELAAMFPRCS
jgi:hypothetical protein